jgi:uncharacterized repeat protein (TIGR01451 family)
LQVIIVFLFINYKTCFMKTKFYSIKTLILSACLVVGLGQTVSAQTIETFVRNRTTGGDGTIAMRGEVLIYTVNITNGPKTLFSAVLHDAVPAGTSYEPGSTTMSGVAIPDVNGTMPFDPDGQPYSLGNQPGILNPNTVVTVIFRAKVTATSGLLTNTARFTATDNTNTVVADITTNPPANTAVQADLGCNIVYQATGTSIRGVFTFNRLATVKNLGGATGGTVYDGTTGSCEDKNGIQLPGVQLFTNVSAIAYDRDLRRMYFVNDDITTAQNLGYVDLNRPTPAAVDLGVALTQAVGAGNNITRMTTGTNGTFYALTDNAQDLINFSFKNPIDPNAVTISHSVTALIDDAANLPNNAVANATGGDIVCDATGKLYLISGNNKVYTIDPLTLVAKYMGTISGLGTKIINSAAIDNNGILYVGGTYSAPFQVSLTNLTATALTVTSSSGDFATCGLPIHPSRVATNERPTVNKPAVTLTSEVFAKVQPNPFHNELNLQVQLNTTEQVRVQLVDFFGRTVYTTSEKLTAGVNSLRLPVPANLSAGIYVVELWAGDKRLLQKKLVKQ